MKNLESKHISPYLDNNLKMIFQSKGGRIIELKGMKHIDGMGSVIMYHSGSMWLHSSGFKPILRPLSDLTKKIEVNGEKFVPSEFLNNNAKKYYLPENWDSVLFIEKENIKSVPFAVIEKLYEWHFDVFDLIGSGLAIDINTLK